MCCQHQKRNYRRACNPELHKKTRQKTPNSVGEWEDSDNVVDDDDEDDNVAEDDVEDEDVQDDEVAGV